MGRRSQTLLRTNRPIGEAARGPGSGTGKPERLSGGLSGCSCLRIDQEHRLVYTVDGDQLAVLTARYHC